METEAQAVEDKYREEHGGKRREGNERGRTERWWREGRGMLLFSDIAEAAAADKEE